MNDDEYERVRREIGWHSTWGDVVFFAVVIAAVWLLVALS